MATPVFCCGFECGLSGSAGQHWKDLSGAITFDTTTKRSGARALKANPSASATQITMGLTLASNIIVLRFYLRFATLPGSDIWIVRVFNSNPTAIGGLRFATADNTIRATAGALQVAASGAVLTTNTWYRIDMKLNTSTNPLTCDLTVDGVSQTQATDAVAGSNARDIKFFDGTWTGEGYVDDVLLSHTVGDFPLGPGKVEHFIPTSDGTHNIAGTGDFQRTLTGTDILNATTTAYQLIDDVPLDSSATDWVNILAPVNATDYVEVVIGPASGISAPTTGPRGVEAIIAIHQSGTGAGNMEVRLNDNGSMGTIYTATGVAGTTTLTYKRAHFADPPSAASVWNANNDGSNGDFRDLRVRIGSPGAVDANPDQYVDSVMIEAEFVTNNAYTMPASAGSYSFTGNAATLKRTIIMDAAATSYSLIGNDVAMRKGIRMQADAGSFGFIGHDIFFTRSYIVAANAGSYALTGNAAGVNKGSKVPVDAGSYSLAGNDITMRRTRVLGADAGSYSLAGNTVSLLRTRIMPATATSFALNGNDVAFKFHRMLASSGAYTLNGNDVSFIRPGRLEATAGSYSLTGNTVSLKFNRRTQVDAGSYLLTGNDVTLTEDTTGLSMPANAGSYALSGNNVDLVIDRILSTGSGSYLLTGIGVSFAELVKQVVTKKSRISGVPANRSRVHGGNKNSGVQNNFNGHSNITDAV